MEPDAERVAFTDTIYQVTEQLSKMETEHLKFLCSDHIPSGSLESMDATDIMRSLHERRIITAEKHDFLAECLVLLGRLDLANRLNCGPDHIEELSNNLTKYNSIAGLNRFKILLFHLAENITKEEVKKIILYLDGKVPLPKGKMGMCQSGIQLMNVLIKADFANPKKLKNLNELGKRLNRIDLIEKIKTYSDFSDPNDADVPKPPNNIQQESNGMEKEIKEESIDSKSEIKQESSADRKSLPSDWQELVECIPQEKHYSFCEELKIPRKKYKICRDNLGELLSNSFGQGMDLGVLEEALKRLSLKEPLSLEKFQPTQPSSSSSSSSTTSSDLGNNLEKYQMTAKPRGICLIINNECFQNGQKKREGSTVDRDALKTMFESFHFEVIVADNLTKGQIIEKLKEVASIDHNKYNCFVCCILSHGSEDHFFGVDGQTLPYRMLTTPFKPGNCKGLTGKPKLFFIQACQGKTYQMGTDDYEFDGVSPPLIPNEADFLLAHSTVRGYLSIRSTSKGSWYIQNLCTVFTQHAKRLDVSDMLLMVNNSVSKKAGMIEGQLRVQMPAPLSTLRKKIHFLDVSD